MKRSLAATLFLALSSASAFSTVWASSLSSQSGAGSLPGPIATSFSGSSSGSGSSSASGAKDYDAVVNRPPMLPKPNPPATASPRLRSNTQSSKIPLIVGSSLGGIVLIAVVVFIIGRRRRRPPVELPEYESDKDDFAFQSLKPPPRSSRRSDRWSHIDHGANSLPLQAITSPMSMNRERPVVASSPALGLTIHEEDIVAPPTSPLNTSKDFLRHTISAPSKSHKLLSINTVQRHTMVDRGFNDCDSLYNSFISDDLFATTLPDKGDNGDNGIPTPAPPPPPPRPIPVPAPEPPSCRENRSLSNVSYVL